MEKVHVGVIGCGWFGNFHIDNLLQMENVHIVALATSNTERRKKTAEKVPGVHEYHTYEEMFDKEKELDAVIVTATPARHGDLEKKACEKGIALYIEKPIGLDMCKVEDNVKCIEESGIICSVGYQGRYNPDIKQLKSYLSNKKTGLVIAKWIGSMPAPLWWRLKEQSGGQMVEQTTHLFDMLRYLFGEVKSVYAAGRKDPSFGGAEHDVEDFSTATLEFKNGVLANVLSGCYINEEEGGREDIGLEIFTDQGNVRFTWDQKLSFLEQDRTYTKNLTGGYHFIALSAFVDAVQKKDPSKIRSSYADAAKTLKVTLACDASMELHKKVEL